MASSTKYNSQSNISREGVDYDTRGSILATLTMFILALIFILIPRYLYLLRLDNDLIRTNTWLDHVEKILDEEVDSHADDTITIDTI